MKAIWNVGKGYVCKNPKDKVILSLITGRGKQSFDDILFNMEVCRRVGRDAYCEKVVDEKTGMLLNLIPINTGTMRHVYNSKGILIRYEQVTKTGDSEKVIKFKPEEIFHLSNNMLSDQSRGISDIESLDSTLLAELESFDSTRKIMAQQAKPFIIFRWKTDDETKIALMKKNIDNLRKIGEDLHIPDDDNTISHEVVSANPSPMVLSWRNDIHNRLYRALGMPLVIFGSANSTESGSKMEYFAHEQVFEHDQRYIEQQVKMQLGVEIDLIPPQSMAPALAQDTMKDGMAGGMNLQQNDITAGSGK